MGYYMSEYFQNFNHLIKIYIQCTIQNSQTSEWFCCLLYSKIYDILQEYDGGDKPHNAIHIGVAIFLHWSVNRHYLIWSHIEMEIVGVSNEKNIICPTCNWNLKVWIWASE